MQRAVVAILGVGILILILLLVGPCSSESSNSLTVTVKKLADDGDFSDEDLDSAWRFVRSAKYKESRKFEDKYELFNHIYCSQADRVKVSSFPYPESYNVNVFIESSGSMRGYYSKKEGLISELLRSLSSIKRLRYCKDLSINTVGGAGSVQRLYLKSDETLDLQPLEKCLDVLTVGESKTSKLSDLFRTVLGRVDSHNVAIFVSDCIYGVKNNENPLQTLHLEGEKVKNAFTECLRRTRSGLTAVALQFMMPFIGSYFGVTRKFSDARFEQRPVYVWVIGNQWQVESIIRASKTVGVFANSANHAVFNTDIQQSDCVGQTISARKIPDRGSFVLSSNPKERRSEIAEASPSEDTRMFGFGLDLTCYDRLRGPSYYEQSSSYKISDASYRMLPFERGNRSSKARSAIKITVIMEKSPVVRQEDFNDHAVTIDILRTIPVWVESANSDDDSYILEDVAEQAKTLGLKTLMTRVNEAFVTESKLPHLASFTVNVNVNKR
jgi:hypothetical protein